MVDLEELYSLVKENNAMLKYILANESDDFTKNILANLISNRMYGQTIQI